MHCTYAAPYLIEKTLILQRCKMQNKTAAYKQFLSRPKDNPFLTINAPQLLIKLCCLIKSRFTQRMPEKMSKAKESTQVSAAYEASITPKL